MRTSNPMRVGVLFGGRSGEHEVSLASARNVMKSLTEAGHTVIPLGISRTGRWITSNDPHLQLTTASQAMGGGKVAAPRPADEAEGWALIPAGSRDSGLAQVQVIFPVLHGPFGEDGTVQGLLEMANVPYVGCGVLASAVGMDKALCKQVFAAAGLQQSVYRLVLRPTWQAQRDQVLGQIEGDLTYPLFVKPANLGSSIGISKARNRAELCQALDLAARYDRRMVVEEAVANVREIEVSVLGNDDPIASVPGEIVPGNTFYDYAAKYVDDNSDLIIPAELTEAQSDQVRQMAVAAFQAIDGAGLARVDFLMDRETGGFYVNEINTLPGFTRISMYPKLWEATGIPYPDLVDRLVQLAVARHAERQETSTIIS